MPLHIIGNRILTDEEFKEEREGHLKWVVPFIGYIALVGAVGLLFPVWTENNPWFIFPLLLLAYVRAGLFELIGSIAIIVAFFVGAFSVFSG